ncbi:hypothetical protein [Streptococcus sp. S784/96/1]|uniref:hypothetical protein n=1 Tax=Streptococcus sp. S784/96/1 TaxID=2653499 RepID=UPI0013876461|nr:hypothetical protein [Streptococcus sp. S784/96/1]
MKLSQIMRVLFQVSNAKQYNSLTHFLQKMPWLGKKIPNRWYRADDVKVVMMILKGLLIPVDLFGKSIIYTFFCLGSGFVLKELLPKFLDLEKASADHYSLTLMIIFSVLFATIFEMKWVEKSDVESSQAIRIFKILPRNYLLAREVMVFGRGLIARSVVFGVYFGTLGMPFGYGLTFALLLSGLRIGVKVIGIPLYVWNHEKADKLMTRGQIIGFFVVVGLGGALVFLGEQFSPQIFMGLPAGLIGLVMWLFSYHYLKNHPQINQLTRSLLTHAALKESATAVENIEAAAMEIKDKDFEINHQKVIRDDLTGVAFLNAIFMQRLGKHLKREIKWRLIIIGGIGALILIVKTIFESNKQVITDDTFFWQSLFVTVVIGYLLYVGESYVKFCFYHLDRPLLKYHYYRRKDVILATFLERFKSYLRHNFPIFLLLSVIYCLIYMAFFDWNIAGLLMIIVGQILSVTFFSLYFLYFYFLLQPFNDGMKSKSKLYNILTGIIYYAGYQIIRLANHMTFPILMGILLGIAIFLIAGFFAVLRFAPKTFKLRS